MRISAIVGAGMTLHNQVTPRQAGLLCDQTRFTGRALDESVLTGCGKIFLG